MTMPKKKNKKLMTETEKGHTVADKNSAESGNEAYERKNCGRREIQSNWDRYRPESPKLGDECAHESDDFADLLKAPSDCNYFRFKSEMNWEREAAVNGFGAHKLFQMDLELLSKGLACIPFYERVSLDKSNLSHSVIESCDKQAEESSARYKPILERFLHQLESENNFPCLNKETNVHVNLKSVENLKESSDSSVNLFKTSENGFQLLTQKTTSNSSAEKKVKHINSGEDLEHWLDSVLDD